MASRRLIPSDRLIALASSVVISKPEELSIEEYISLLRQHGAKGRRDQALSTTHRHLDRSSHWRSEYLRMKAACEAAEGKIAGLELENESWKRNLEKPRPASPTKKRKKQADEDIIPVPRSPKRPRQGDAMAKHSFDAVQLAADLDLGRVGVIGSMLLCRVYNVQKHVRDHRIIDPPALAQHLIQATASVIQVVRKAIPEVDASLTIDLVFLRSVLYAADRSVQQIITATARLASSLGGQEVLGHVVHACVQMYDKLLDILENVAALETKSASRETSTSAQTKQVSPSKSKPKLPKQVNMKEIESLALITKLLCSIIDKLNANIEVHKSLYEGFAYVVLKRLGSSLYHLVFGHSRGTSIGDEIVAYHEVDEIDAMPEDTQASDKEQQMKAAKLEAPYLIHLLTRVMNAAPAHLDAAILTRRGKPKQAVKGSMKESLAVDAKERLQRTLLNCMFGEEGTEDEFHDALKMPALKGPPLPMPKIKEPETKEWFKEEVWRLLGWEILSREIEA